MISVIVIEYYSLDDIEYFYKCSRGYLGDECEVIVSSNSLYIESEQHRIATKFSFARWQFNPYNGGFAYAMNEGLKIAKGEFLIVMNPDVKLRSSIEPMLKYLQKHLMVGIIAPKIIDNSGIIQDSLRHFITPGGFILRHLNRIIHKRKLNVKDLHDPVSVDWVIGAFMMCRRDFYENVGGLSSDYFMYCEDMDWCKRAHYAGYDVVYFPGTVIEYKGTRAARHSWKFSKIFIKSLFTYWKKYGIK